MPQVIQCPTCSKKYKLPDVPPATFTCTGCQTVMDLSGFRTAAAAAPVAAAAASSTRSSSSGSSATRTRSLSAARGAARARARSGRDEDEGDDEGGGARRGPPKNNNALIIGSLFGLVIIGGMLLLVLKKKAPAEPAPVAKAPVDATVGQPPPAAMTVEPAMEEEKPAPEAPKFVPASKVQFHAIDHHPDATPEERTKIDQLIQTAVFENSGSDGRIAEDELAKLGVKAAPRLINVFSTVKMGAGFDDRLGKIHSSVADRILRRIDGFIERSVGKHMTALKPQSDSKWIENVARQWIMWWDNEKYKTPQKPWDEKIDGGSGDAPSGSSMDDSGMKPEGMSDEGGGSK